MTRYETALAVVRDEFEHPWARWPRPDLGALGFDSTDALAAELASDRWLLVERSVHDGAGWYASWPTVADAVDYHEGQEYPGDWTPEHLVDLDTGEVSSYNDVVRSAFRGARRDWIAEALAPHLDGAALEQAADAVLAALAPEPVAGEG